VSTSAVAGAGAATAAEGARAMCRRPRKCAVEGARGAALGAVDGHADAIRSSSGGGRHSSHP
jgi:hypothetical protein